MTTAEYGIGTLCTAVIGCGVLALTSNEWFTQFLSRIFALAFDSTLPELLGWVG